MSIYEDNQQWTYTFPGHQNHAIPSPVLRMRQSWALPKYFTDHMFVMDYDEGQGWHDGRIVPHAPFLIEPASARPALCPDDVRGHEGLPLPRTAASSCSARI